jgi:sec-independent protein translocase protein TatB
MLDIGWAELMFLAVLALIVVGPKDLPKLARSIGKLWGKIQRMYRDTLASIHKLETEMDLAAKPDERGRPSYYDLLPEHVREAMEKSEPSRDAAENQRVQALYEEAMAEIKAAHEPAGTAHCELPQNASQTKADSALRNTVNHPPTLNHP